MVIGDSLQEAEFYELYGGQAKEHGPCQYESNQIDSEDHGYPIVGEHAQ